MPLGVGVEFMTLFVGLLFIASGSIKTIRLNSSLYRELVRRWIYAFIIFTAQGFQKFFWCLTNTFLWVKDKPPNLYANHWCIGDHLWIRNRNWYSTVSKCCMYWINVYDVPYILQPSGTWWHRQCKFHLFNYFFFLKTTVPMGYLIFLYGLRSYIKEAIREENSSWYYWLTSKNSSWYYL